MSERDGRAAAELLAGTRWLGLATLAADGEPSVSYFPFARLEGGFGIVVSGLAAHAAQLAAHPRVAALFLGEPDPGGDPFARPRLSVDAVAHDRSGTPAGDAIWEALAGRNGATVAVLRGLPDFRPFFLVPIRARLVLGFARASELEGAAVRALCDGVRERPQPRGTTP
jgi:putative heme iron utilization protein